MGGATLVGWFFPYAMLALREVHLRPISRREIWLARGIIAATTCAIPAMMLAIALPFRSAGPADWVTVTVTILVLNLLYVGAVAGVTALVPVNFHAASKGPIKVALIVVYFMSPFWLWTMPFLWHVRPSDFTSATWCFVALASGLVVAAARHAPAPGTMLPRIAARSSGQGAMNQRIDASSWLRSLPFMLAAGARQALLLAGVVVVAISVLNRVAAGQWLLTAADPMLAPFTGRAGTFDVTTGSLWLLFGSPGAEASRYSLRHLRALPMTTTALASILVVMRCFNTTAAWLVLLTMASLATGTRPAHLRLDLFSMALGLAAVGVTASLAVGKPGWRGQIPLMFCAVATADIIQHNAGTASPGASVVLWSTGPVLVGLSIAVCRILLNRRTALYRRPQPNWSGGMAQV